MHFYQNGQGQLVRKDGTLAGFSRLSKGRSGKLFIHMTPAHRMRMDAAILRDHLGSGCDAIVLFFDCYCLLLGLAPQPAWLEHLQAECQARMDEEPENCYLPTCVKAPPILNGRKCKGRTKGVLFHVTPAFRDRLKGAFQKNDPKNFCDVFSRSFDSYLYLIGEIPAPDWLGIEWASKQKVPRPR
jgi:hypothetical protein